MTMLRLRSCGAVCRFAVGPRWALAMHCRACFAVAAHAATPCPRLTGSKVFPIGGTSHLLGRCPYQARCDYVAAGGKLTHPSVGYAVMEGLMLVAEEAVEIRVLKRQGKSIREIARTLDVLRNTVRRYLRVKDCRPTSARRGGQAS